LIDSLHRKVNELHQYESIARSQHDYELVLSTTREKHEHEIIELNEKLQHIQMNLQEKVRIKSIKPRFLMIMIFRISKWMIFVFN
jgi:hypothetical protein